MARTITTKSGIKPSEGTTYRLDPFDIVVDEDYRGRASKPTAEYIQQLAISLGEQGQIHPVYCRAMEDKSLHLFVGFCRVAAARLRRVGFTTADGTVIHDPDFLIETRVVDVKYCNDAKALLINIAENGQRKNLSPIDLARAVVTLTSEPYNYLRKDVAEAYGVQASRIARVTKLLNLAPEVQEMVDSGLISEHVGLYFAEETDLLKQVIWVTKAKELAGDDNINMTYANKANKELDQAFRKQQQEAARELAEREAEAISRRQTSTVAPLPPNVLNDAEKVTETVTEASAEDEEDTEGEPFDGGYPVSTPATTTEETPKLTLTITPANGVMYKEEANAPAPVVAPTVRKRALTLGEIKELFSSLPDYNTCLTAFSSITTAVLSGEMTAEEYSDQLVGLLAGDEE